MTWKMSINKVRKILKSYKDINVLYAKNIYQVHKNKLVVDRVYEK